MTVSEEAASESKPVVIGKITNVKTSFVQVKLSPAEGEGGGAILANVGDFVTIPAEGFLLFGQITDINSANKGTTLIEFEANVKLLLSVDKSSKNVTTGVAAKPVVGTDVYTAPAELIKTITDPAKSSTTHGPQIAFQLAKLQHAAEIPISFTPETLFGRHCAIFGTTGSGKSWSIAKLLEEGAKYNSKMILFDATGEFHTVQDKVLHVQLGTNHMGTFSSQPITEVAMPYSQLTENDLFAIFQPTGQSQALKLRTAIKTLKLIRLDPEISLDGTFIKANKMKKTYESAYRRNHSELEKPNADFDIRHLARQIGNECVKPIRSTTEPGYWGEKNTAEHSECIPMIARIEEMIQSDTLSPIFKPGGKISILDVVEHFLSDKTKSILRISLEHLSFEHCAREIIANAIGRFLMAQGRARRFKEKPVLLVIDEAHQFLNNLTNNEDQQYSLDSFALIAKEGRKYCINIGIVTQRPRDIPEGVLSQVGTFIVHRLINEFDLSVVARASGQIDHGSMEAIPILSSGEAVILGVDFPFPMKLTFDPPKNPPSSSGPDYQKDWR